MTDKRWHEIELALEELEQKRDALLDERAQLNEEPLKAAERADQGELKTASTDFLKELDQL